MTRSFFATLDDRPKAAARYELTVHLLDVREIDFLPESLDQAALMSILRNGQLIAYREAAEAAPSKLISLI